MTGRFRLGKMSIGIRDTASTLPSATATTATMMVYRASQGEDDRVHEPDPFGGGHGTFRILYSNGPGGGLRGESRRASRENANGQPL